MKSAFFSRLLFEHFLPDRIHRFFVVVGFERYP